MIVLTKNHNNVIKKQDDEAAFRFLLSCDGGEPKASLSVLSWTSFRVPDLPKEDGAERSHMLPDCLFIVLRICQRGGGLEEAVMRQTRRLSSTGAGRVLKCG